MVSYPKEGGVNLWEEDGTIEYEDSSTVATLVTILLVFLVGIFLGVMGTLTSVTCSVKEHYCIRYNTTQEYIACKSKPIQEIYSLMEER